jgi:hypothetical protein
MPNFTGFSRKYKVNKTTTYSDGRPSVYTTYSMITPTAGEVTPPSYTIVYPSLNELKFATTAEYKAQLDLFLPKCGLSYSQVIQFKDTAEINDNACVLVYAGELTNGVLSHGNACTLEPDTAPIYTMGGTLNVGQSVYRDSTATAIVVDGFYRLLLPNTNGNTLPKKTLELKNNVIYLIRDC